MKHILYVLPEIPPSFGGGIATVYGQLLPRLVVEGLHVTVLLTSLEHINTPQYKWQGVDVIPLQSWSLSQAEAELSGWRQNAFIHQFLPLAWAAWIQAQELGPFDLVETTDWALLFLPWLVQRRSQPVVVSLHGSCGQVDWHGNPWGRGGEGQLVRLLETAALPLADRLIANSILNAEFWWQQCGVRPKVIPPIAAEQDHTAGVQARSDRGLVVGRLQNWKGPEVLCNALRELPGQHIDWIGKDTPWQESSISTATHLRRQFPDVVDHQLHLLGQLPPEQVRLRIRQAAYLCIPSLWDVFNVTVLEALTAGIPVICSSKAGASMMIKHGLSGYLFDVQNPYDLVHCIKEVQGLALGELDQLSVNAKKAVNCNCDSASVLRNYILCYELVASQVAKDTYSEWLLSFLLGKVNSKPRIPSLVLFECAYTLLRRIERKLSCFSFVKSI